MLNTMQMIVVKKIADALMTKLKEQPKKTFSVHTDPISLEKFNKMIQGFGFNVETKFDGTTISFVAKE